MIRLNTTALLAPGLLAATLFTGGCSSDLSSADLRDNWTPELQSVAMSEEQFDNYRSRHRHNAWRQVADDWALIWLDDRNLKLTRYSMPSR